ncbi:MAG: TetR/AcrR family transcriptional regulator [Leptolyngbya sp. SIOISBB]|nr:TetR/AcrR family transcriptional regulator [Leptolyngbya sp. SIOISBB]
MSKAQHTRDRIIEQAAKLFNQQGFAGVSMSALMAATGLKKGGLYNHFASKDELAIAAFNYSVQLASQRQFAAMRCQRRADDRLRAMVQTFVDNFDEISAWGGCPLMNTAIDSDDAHPQLREHARLAMNRWRELIEHIAQKGVERREFASQTDPRMVATIVISVLEGALALARLDGDRLPMQQAQTHLDSYINSLVWAPDTS